MPNHILYIQSSIFGAQGESSRLAAQLVEQLRHRLGDISVTERRLTADTPHLDAETFRAIIDGKPTPSDDMVAEVQAADVLVIGAPMYNFGIPSPLKAWFDHIPRAGVTFRYTDKGPEGLLTGKKTYVITTRGGNYKDTAMDAQVPFLRTVLGFLGLSDVEFIYGEGLNLGSGSRDQGRRAAEAHMVRLAGCYAEQAVAADS